MRNNREEESQEREMLEWRERLCRLQAKYADTPPGFTSEKEAQKVLKQLKQELEEYEARKEYRLLGSYQAPEEPFVGREDYLAQIERQMAAKNGPVILYGIGGIGKTALARAYIRRHEARYDAVLFLSYNTGIQAMVCDDCRLAIKNLRYSADKYENKNRYFKEKIRILTEIAERIRLLIVVDDCNTENDRKMEALFAVPCDFLVTTRVNPVLWGYDTGIRVRELGTEEEWTQFIRLYQKKELTGQEWEELRSYRKKVNGHTLLMAMRIHEERQEIAAEKNGNTEIAMPGEIAEDFFARFSMKRAEKQAMRELSIMPVQGIGEDFYLQISQVRKQSVDWLADHLLIRREPSGSDGSAVLSLHPLIAEAARKIFAPTMENCQKLIQGLHHKVYNGWNRTYQQNQALEPYVFALLEAFPEPEGWLSRQMEEMVTLLWIQGYYEEAESYCLKIVEAAERYYGKIHQTTGEMYLRLAAVYHNSLDFKRAEAWYWRGYEVINQCRPFDIRYHYVRSLAFLKISRIYRFQGDYQKALEACEESIRCAEQFGISVGDRAIPPWDGSWERHYHYTLLDKAKILLELGRTAEAEEIGLRGKQYMLERREKTGESFGGNEFDSLLAEIHMKRKEFAKAEKLCRDIVEQAEEYRGRYYKYTLSNREQLADVYRGMGKCAEALDEYEKILHILLKEYPYQKQWFGRVWKKRKELTEC